jgi:mercuric ion transport protein
MIGREARAMPLRLVYFEGCPNAGAARAALERAGLAYEAVRQDDLGADHPWRRYTSPTLLDGDRVLFGAATAGGGGCTVPAVPPADLLAGLGGGGPTAGRRPPAGILSTVGAVGSASAVAFCPICYPAIGTFLAAIGLGVVVSEAALRSLVLALLALGWFGLWWSYRREHGRVLPLALGVAAGAALFAGRYVWFTPPVMYAGVAGMIGAGAWNLLLRRRCRGGCGRT